MDNIKHKQIKINMSLLLMLVAVSKVDAMSNIALDSVAELSLQEQTIQVYTVGGISVDVIARPGDNCDRILDQLKIEGKLILGDQSFARSSPIPQEVFQNGSQALQVVYTPTGRDLHESLWIAMNPAIRSHFDTKTITALTKLLDKANTQYWLNEIEAKKFYKPRSEAQTSASKGLVKKVRCAILEHSGS